MVISLLAVASTAFRCGPAAPGGALARRRTRPPAVVMMEEVECDVVIVGGGPAGCTCALYTSRADHKTVMLDKNPSVGALAITSLIANYPGVKNDMSGQALLDEMSEHLLEHEILEGDTLKGFLKRVDTAELPTL